MQKSILLVLGFALLGGYSCEQAPKAPKEKKIVKAEGLVQHRRSDGSLASEITYKDKKRNGYAKGYYEDGSLQGEFNYENDLLHGVAKIYYQNGPVYQETPHTHGKKDGIQKIYRKNGSLLAEVPYKLDELAIGTVEYTEAGKPKKQLPTLEVQQIDKLLQSNQYIVRVSLSEKNKKAMFYMGALTDGKYKNNKLVLVPAPEGVLELKYTIPPGAFMMETIHIVVETQTKMKTPYLLQTKVNIAAENKGY
jgi:hypothetical protein